MFTCCSSIVVTHLFAMFCGEQQSSYTDTGSQSVYAAGHHTEKHFEKHLNVLAMGRNDWLTC